MTAEADPASLSIGELVALVGELRRRLAEKDREIARLRRFLPAAPEAASEAVADAAAESLPGSVEDLLAQLEQIYPEDG